MKVYARDRAHFRDWLFELFVAIGQINSRLARDLRALVKKGCVGDPMEWNACDDDSIDQEIYEEFNQELYGLLVSLTEGEPLGLIKWLVERDDADGYKAILMMVKRFDPKTTGSMLRSFM